jgi:hypothetical protein
MNPDLNSIARALDRLVAAQEKGAWNYISTVAVVLTLIVIIWYTIETSRLRKAAQDQTKETGKLLTEAQKQNEVAVMPCLAISPARPSSADGQCTLVLKNVGTGPAFNVSIHACASSGKQLSFEYGEDFMGPNEKRELTFYLQEGSSQERGTNTGALYRWITDGKLPEPLTITARSRSVSSIDYASTFKLTRSEDRLKVAFEREESIPRA